MKIVFTGGGTGGHFYPIIAVAQEIQKIIRENNLIEPELYFIAPEPYNIEILFNNHITYREISTGKKRLYRSSSNIPDMIKTFFAILKAIWVMFWIYPDVVFSKGGYGSVPAVIAARILRIPIIIHESDGAPGRANQMAGKFATKIAVSYPQAAEYFSQPEKVAWTGNPVRDTIKQKAVSGAHTYLDLDPSLPTILILGGSQGAQVINNIVIDALGDLIKNYQIIHQTGKSNYTYVTEMASVVLDTPEKAARYKAFKYLNDTAIRMAAGAADIVITRAGSTLFEIALWGVPSIIIPITESNADHQRINAYTYARNKAATVIEEDNATPTIVMSEINRILNDPEKIERMKQGALSFAKPDAARTIADAIMQIVLKHES